MQQLLTEKAAKIVSTLIERKMTIATAESCTGGLVSSLITAVSGASSVFGLGMCSYAANAKINNLGVNAETIEKYGTVSEFTAKEMAENIRRLAAADFGVSVTGVAGPNPTEGKPVGLVYIALSCEEETLFKKLNLENNGRDFIRNSATDKLFDLIIEYLNPEENQ